MTDRALLILANPQVRERAARWAQRLPDGTRVEFRGPQRTLDQNDRMWAMLTDIARQHEHHGKRYDASTWKVIFLTALGQEISFVPSLDGKSFIPLGTSSSKLSKAEMSDLIEYLFSWGAENAIVWSDPTLVQGSVAA